MNRAEFLRRVPLFANLPPNALADIGALCHEEIVARDECLFFEGDPATALFIVVEGRVKVAKQSESGQETILRVLAEGDLLAVVAALGDDRYPASAQAIRTARVWRLSAQSFEALIARHPPLALAVIRLLKAHVTETQELLRQMVAERVERRIAYALLRLMDKVGRASGEGIELSMPLSRQDLASMAGTTVETTSRVLSKFENAGIVQASRERVVIADPHALMEIAADVPKVKESLTKGQQ